MVVWHAGALIHKSTWVVGVVSSAMATTTTTNDTDDAAAGASSDTSVPPPAVITEQNDDDVDHLHHAASAAAGSAQQGPESILPHMRPSTLPVLEMSALEAFNAAKNPMWVMTFVPNHAAYVFANHECEISHNKTQEELVRECVRAC